MLENHRGCSPSKLHKALTQFLSHGENVSGTQGFAMSSYDSEPLIPEEPMHAPVPPKQSASPPFESDQLPDLIDLSSAGWTPLDAYALDLHALKGWRVRVIQPGLFACSNRHAYLHQGEVGTVSCILQVGPSRAAVVKLAVTCPDLMKHSHTDIDILVESRCRFEVHPPCSPAP